MFSVCFGIVCYLDFLFIEFIPPTAFQNFQIEIVALHYFDPCKQLERINLAWTVKMI